MSGFTINMMMMHLFKRLRKDVSVLYSKNIAYVLDMSGSRVPAAVCRYRGNLKKKKKRITVRGKTGEGRRVLTKETRWILGLWRNHESQAVKTSGSHKWGDSRFPGEIPKGEVTSARKKCFSWGKVKIFSKKPAWWYNHDHQLTHFHISSWFSFQSVWGSRCLAVVQRIRSSIKLLF